MDRFSTAEFAELVRRFAIRSTVLPPAAIAMLNDDDTIVGLAPLKYVRSITAPLSPLQARRFTGRDAKAHPEKIGAVGRPTPVST